MHADPPNALRGALRGNIPHLIMRDEFAIGVLVNLLTPVLGILVLVSGAGIAARERDPLPTLRDICPAFRALGHGGAHHGPEQQRPRSCLTSTVMLHGGDATR